MNGLLQKQYEVSQKFNLEVQTIAHLQSLYNDANDALIKEKLKTILNDRLDSLIEPKVV